jgi:hypothetical protein
MMLQAPRQLARESKRSSNGHRLHVLVKLGHRGMGMIRERRALCHEARAPNDRTTMLRPSMTGRVYEIASRCVLRQHEHFACPVAYEAHTMRAAPASSAGYIPHAYPNPTANPGHGAVSRTSLDPWSHRDRRTCLFGSLGVHLRTNIHLRDGRSQRQISSEAYRCCGVVSAGDYSTWFVAHRGYCSTMESMHTVCGGLKV